MCDSITVKWSEAIIYGGLFIAIATAFFLGRSLDRRQSNNHAVWKTGCIGMNTVFQSAVLGLLLGPLVYLVKGGKEEMWWCVLSMAAAPFVVDLLRPTVTIRTEGEKLLVVPTQFVNRLNVANLLAIVLCSGLIGAFICWNLFGRNGD